MSLVLWSGGCDSTLVLYDLAKEEGTKGNPIRAISIEHTQVGAKAKQRNACKRILSRFEKIGLHVRHGTIKIITCNNSSGSGSAGLPQPVIWMPPAVLSLGEVEDLYVGYVRGDDVWHYRTELFNLFNTCKNFLAKKGNLIAPLEWKPKHTVIEELRKARLYEFTWWCEDPKGGLPCGKCESCLTHNCTLQGMKKARASKPRRKK